jgi:hypothetical protein
MLARQVFLPLEPPRQPTTILSKQKCLFFFFNGGQEGKNRSFLESGVPVGGGI